MVIKSFITVEAVLRNLNLERDTEWENNWDVWISKAKVKIIVFPFTKFILVILLQTVKRFYRLQL